MRAALLAQFSSVTIEKFQGSEAPIFLYEEDAMVASARQIKAVNPAIAVYVWFDSMRIYTANKTLNPDITPHCATGNFQPATFLETHREYLLLNRTNQPALEPWSHCHIYDFTKDFVRQYWLDMCLNMTATGVIDGCGADASWQVDPANNTTTPAVAAAWDVGHRQMMNETATALAPNGILLGKMVRHLSNAA